ncbi:hypothetical protein [Jiella pelagia]|uniref:Uncharacterized protein n=1 Tax=Jiella pelagia TaxID=2986949 RepID=A0ABY7BYX2_9HYPH|nr:hypothetical protein [Jiella pelagia]WAP69061.1 hypothetical protein OH818_01620 [Jiella pelagia]
MYSPTTTNNISRFRKQPETLIEKVKAWMRREFLSDDCRYATAWEGVVGLATFFALLGIAVPFML